MSASLREAGFSPHEADLGHIDSPGEQIRLGAPFTGRVRCDELIIEYGVSCDIDVKARRIVVGGSLRGVVEAETLFVTSEGSLVGEVTAERVEAKGRLRGLIHAREILAVAGATIQGQVIADSLGLVPGAQVTAQAVAGPGCFGRDDLLERARSILGPSDVPLAETTIVPPQTVQRQVRPLAPPVERHAGPVGEPERLRPHLI